MSPAPRPVTLTWPFAAAGLVGGTVLGHLLLHDASEPRWLVLCLAISTTVVAGRLGHRLSGQLAAAPPDDALPRPWWPPVVGRSLLAGGCNALVLLAGLMIGCLVAGAGGGDPVVLWLFPGSVIAFVLGVAAAVPFIPSLVVMAGAYRRAHQARAGSIARGALVRRLWLATSATAAVHLAIAAAFTEHRRGCIVFHSVARPLVALLGLALVGAALTLAAEVRGWLVLDRAVALAARLTRSDPSEAAPAALVHRDTLDLGAGEAHFLAIHRADNPYRAVDHRHLVLVGDPEATRVALRDATRWIVGGLVLALAAPSLVAGLFLLAR